MQLRTLFTNFSAAHHRDPNTQPSGTASGNGDTGNAVNLNTGTQPQAWRSGFEGSGSDATAGDRAKAASESQTTFQLTSGSWGGHSLRFEKTGVPAIDTTTDTPVECCYVVTGSATVRGETLIVSDFVIKPEGYFQDYTVRPGRGAMKSVMDSLMRRMAKEYPDAKTVEVHRVRVTVGYKGRGSRTKSYDLTRFRG